MNSLFEQILLDLSFMALSMFLLFYAKRVESRPKTEVTANQEYSAKGAKGGGIVGIVYGVLLLLRDLPKLFE